MGLLASLLSYLVYRSIRHGSFDKLEQFRCLVQLESDLFALFKYVMDGRLGKTQDTEAYGELMHIVAR